MHIAYINSVKGTKILLPIISVFFVFITILGTNMGVLPFDNTSFYIVAVFAIALALYRPKWVFLLFIAAVPLEVLVFGTVGAVDIRFYQLFAIAAAVGFLVHTHHLAVRPPSGWRWIDVVPLVILISSVISAYASEDSLLSFHGTFILGSFVFLYYLVRLFVRSREDSRDMLPYIFTPYFFISLYAIWQNWRHERGFEAFEVMPGRPNGTFPEADWLGMYLAVGVVILFGILFETLKNKETNNRAIGKKILVYELLFFGIVALIVTVARSAWLAMGSGLAIVSILFWYRFGFSVTLYWARRVAIIFLLALAFVSVFHLTSFELRNRAQSTASGLQEITIACETNTIASVPNRIQSTEELASYGCKHILLEEINEMENAGYVVSKMYRKDPNVTARQNIWKVSLEEIRAHPVVGIGWGAIGKKLGTDERGASFNASNIFLEFWLGAGLLGILGFVVLLGYSGFQSVQCMRSESRFAQGAIVFAALAALIIANLFNSGQFLAFVWVYLAIALTITEEKI